MSPYYAFISFICLITYPLPQRKRMAPGEEGFSFVNWLIYRLLGRTNGPLYYLRKDTESYLPCYSLNNRGALWNGQCSGNISY